MADDLVIGGQLDNYLIESVIGRGGMSVVYRAKHSRLGTSIALKVLAPELSSDDTFRERFLREAQMAAAIDHPNVIPIHDMGLHESSLYIVMRYVAGGDLKALLAESGPLEPEQAIAILTPVALALDAAHSRGLVHRDVKPGNILLQRSAAGSVEHVYLTDFGVAKSVSSVSGLTRAGGVIGTVAYMAPEQTRGGEVSAATDVYALACVLYECLTGSRAFDAELAGGARASEGAPPSVSVARPELPPALDGVIAKALSADPAERYATCEQFLNACSYVLKTHPAGVGDMAGATVAEALPAHAAAPPGPTPGEHPASGGSEPWPPREQEPQPVASAPAGERPARSRRWRYAALLAALLVAVVVIVLVTSSSKNTAAAKPSTAVLGQVPTNHVTGSGNATIRLSGDVATITVTTNGLDNDEALVHALHIHAGGKGQCPPASAARLHNGHLSISTTDGINYYGPPVQSLTLSGDTSTASILAFSRYPTGGVIHYSRTITLPAPVVAYIHQNNAVIVVHGVDYDHSGIYSGVLERSELNRSVPATATAPALCGALVASKSTVALTPRSRRRTLVYTASLTADPAAFFLCEPAAAVAPGALRRLEDASSAAHGPGEIIG